MVDGFKYVFFLIQWKGWWSTVTNYLSRVWQQQPADVSMLPRSAAEGESWIAWQKSWPCHFFFCEHATLDVISKCVKGLPLCRLLYCKCKRGSVSNVYSDSPLTSKMIVPWHIFHMFNGDAKMARPAGRPPSLCLRCTWMTESVSSWRSPTKAFET